MRTPPYLEDLIKNVESSCELFQNEKYVRRIIEIISYMKDHKAIYGSLDTIDSASLYTICQGGPRKHNEIGNTIYQDLLNTYVQRHGEAPFFADRSWYEVDKLLQVMKDMIPDYVMTEE